MKTPRPSFRRLLPILLAGVALQASAERADRDKPIHLEAQRIAIDDAKKTQTLEGDVVLTQGTLVIRADRIVVTEDKYGFQKGIAHAGKDGLARFRQKREGKDEYIEGEAERIEYDTRNEVAELFQRAWVKSGDEEVKGHYIRYDAINERYYANASDARDAKAAGAAGGRVRAVIQPRKKDVDAPAARGGDTAPLRTDNTLDMTREKR